MELKNSEHYNDPTPYEAHKNIRKECAKKRQAEAFHRYYLANREYYAERSKEQSTRRKQSRLEELLAGEPRPFKPPKYTIEQVNNRAIALGISYGWCSYLLSVGKVCME